MGFEFVMNSGGLVMTGEYSLFYRMKPQGTTIWLARYKVSHYKMEILPLQNQNLRKS